MQEWKGMSWVGRLGLLSCLSGCGWESFSLCLPDFEFREDVNNLYTKAATVRWLGCHSLWPISHLGNDNWTI